LKMCISNTYQQIKKFFYFLGLKLVQRNSAGVIHV
jgi:hypothetical protein